MSTITSVPETTPRTAALATQAPSIQPYVFFDGRCDEALEFYGRAAGATVTMLIRFRDNPTPPCDGMPMPPGDKVMHASLRIGGTEILASDGHCAGQAKFEGFALSLTAPTPVEAERLYAALSDGGEIVMPIGETFFSPKFGMFKDRFGVMWMVYVAPGGKQS